MKFIFEIAHRAEINEPAETRHNSLVDFLRVIGKPWGIDSATVIPFPGFGREFTAIAELRKQLGAGIRCTLMYRYRNAFTDHHSCDDRIYYEFIIKKVAYTSLIYEIFPGFVNNFNAYRAEIFPEQLIYEDFEKSRNKNLRESVYRFCPIMYLDSGLCLKALNQSPVKVITKLKPLVERVELFKNGVLYIASSKALTVDECNSFDKEIKTCLGFTTS